MSDPMFDLSGSVALVTGGSRGLGRVMAETFAAHGADLVLAGRKPDACERAAAEIAAGHGVRAVGVPCHVGDWADCDHLVERAYAEFGRIDVLVNNAGMSPLYDSPEDVSEALYDKVLAVNLKGPFRLTAVIGARMAAHGGGSIINISSIAATRPTAHELPYAAAKAGLNSLTVGFAHTFGHTVRVNAIQAGPFLTDISRAWDLDAFAAQAAETIALGRAGEPDEIAGAALYLASRASSYCTGAVLRLDGGSR
ncbi:glucose 1-dehydrogenase [Pseudonocardia kongjuensis]|uniref:Glucose 1-dehydrogenase n=1 Tax=Pseudonocardia kongjuensis TaxID=102227 RepID=A0ABN1Y8D9_9PSEU